MLCRPVYAFFALATLANAQSVISTRSGVIHFFEGDVYLGDQLLEARLGRFPTLPEGAELRTGEGRAEVLLTPGVFLRMDAQSDIRMVSTDLADTQVELLAGSVMVESGPPNPETSVTLIYQNWGIHLLRQGVYRIGADPAQLWVRQGGVEVFAGDSSQPVSVNSGMSLPLADTLAPQPSTGEPGDTLRDWEAGRSESISADNAITAQIDEDPSMRAPGADDFINFPLLGVVSPVAMVDSSGLYGNPAVCAAGMCQPGFNSIYLPGYTYRPLILSLVGRGFPVYTSGPRTFGGVTGIGTGVGVLMPLRTPLGLAPLPKPPALRYPVSGPAPIHALPPRIGGVRR